MLTCPARAMATVAIGTVDDTTVVQSRRAVGSSPARRADTTVSSVEGKFQNTMLSRDGIISAIVTVWMLVGHTHPHDPPF